MLRRNLFALIGVLGEIVDPSLSLEDGTHSSDYTILERDHIARQLFEDSADCTLRPEFIFSRLMQLEIPDWEPIRKRIQVY